MRTHSFTIAALVFCLLACAANSYGQAQPRVYITANRGSDINPCTRTSPCRTVQHALDASVVQQGGEVVILDSGDYQPFTVSASLTPPTVTSVTVEAERGVVAGISSAGAATVTIQAGASDTVTLQGLTIRATGNNAAGIDFQSGAALHVASCTVSAPFGLLVNRSAANDVAHISVADSTFRNCASGIALLNTGSSSLVRAAVDNCRFEGNTNAGVFALENSRVTVRGSVVAGGNNGFLAHSVTSGLTAELNVEHCLVTHNQSGLAATTQNGGAAVIRVSGSTVTDNDFGAFVLGAGASILSRGDNTLEGNASNNTFPGTYLPK